MASLRARTLVLGLLAAACLAAAFIGCGSGSQPTGPETPAGKAGYLSLKVHWPNAEAGTRLIPFGTERLEVVIANADEVATEKTVTIAKSEVVAGSVERMIPVQANPEKRITVQALDGEERQLALASVTVAVVAGQATPVHVQLEATAAAYPIVVATASPDIALPGGTITLTGTAADSDGGPIAKYEWDADGNGTFEHSSTTTGVYAVTPPIGEYTATFRATDGDGLYSEATVEYQIGTRNPEWVTVPTSVEWPVQQQSEQVTLEYAPGFPNAPCTVVVTPGTIVWTPDPSADGSGDTDTLQRGTFSCTDPDLTGVVIATLVLRDGNGRESDPASVRVNIRQGFHGIVSTLFDPPSAVESATVSFDSFTDVTDSMGRYLIHGVGSGTTRMTVTGDAIFTRSFPVATTWSGAQDVTAIPAGYNTYMLRRFMSAPHGAENDFVPGVTQRWRPAPAIPPTFVTYTKFLDAETEVPEATLQIIRAFVVNELPALTDGQLGGAEYLEIFEGRPHDDPRFSGDDTDFGGIWGHNAVAITIVEDFTDTGVAGLGGGGFDWDYWCTGGGATLIQNPWPGLLRHEAGHGLFCWPHPWERMAEDDIPLHIENSIMNYGPAAAWPSPDDNYTKADRDCIRFEYHRGAGNTEPDRDVDGQVGYKAAGGTSFGTLYKDPDWRVNPYQTFPSRKFTVTGGTLTWVD